MEKNSGGNYAEIEHVHAGPAAGWYWQIKDVHDMPVGSQRGPYLDAPECKAAVEKAWENNTYFDA